MPAAIPAAAGAVIPEIDATAAVSPEDNPPMIACIAASLRLAPELLALA